MTCLTVAGLSSVPAERLTAILLPPLENRFKPADLADPDSIAGVIALGGGDNRIVEAGRLVQRWPNAYLVITGAGVSTDVFHLIGANVPRNRIIIEDAARTTHENAAFSAPILERLSGDRGHRAQRWLIVTSASHMPRAIGTFRRAGIDAEAWPVDDGYGSAHDRLSSARHEWLGLGWYWLSGRSGSPFPGPIEARVDRLRPIRHASPEQPTTRTGS